MIVDGVASVGLFLTEEANAVSPPAAVHKTYSFDGDLTINAYKVLGAMYTGALNTNSVYVVESRNCGF